MLLTALGNMFIDSDLCLGIASVPSLEKVFYIHVPQFNRRKHCCRKCCGTVRSGGVALLLVCFEIKFQVAKVSPKLTMEL